MKNISEDDNYMRPTFPKIAILLTVLILAVAASAQTNSNVGNVTLSATLAESLTLTINSGSNLTIAALTPGVANNFGTANVTTDWVLKPGRTAVKLYGYFDSASAALAHNDAANTVDIPSAAIGAQLNGAGAYNAFSNTVAFGAANAGLQIWSTTITGANKTANRTDNIGLQVDLSLTTPTDMTQLPADTYNGTLHLRAQATP